MTRLLKLVWPAVAAFSVVGTALAIQPFYTSNNFSVSQGQDANVVSIEVPLGATCILESMSGRITMPTGQHIVSALLFTDISPTKPNHAVLHFNPHLISQGGGLFEVDVYQFNTLTRAYLTDTVHISLGRAESSGDAHVNVALHGYLIPTLPGDFNANGDVDAADYIVYRNTVGQSGIGLAADVNDNNQVEPLDYSFYRSRFGQSTAGSAAAFSTAVPEPAAIVTLVATLGMLVHRRRSAVAVPDDCVLDGAVRCHVWTIKELIKRAAE